MIGGIKVKMLYTTQNIALYLGIAVMATISIVSTVNLYIDAAFFSLVLAIAFIFLVDDSNRELRDVFREMSGESQRIFCDIVIDDVEHEYLDPSSCDMSSVEAKRDLATAVKTACRMSGMVDV